MHVQISLPFFPNSHYTPGFKLITTGNPFKLFIKMKENGDSSLVVKILPCSHQGSIFLFKWAENKKKR